MGSQAKEVQLAPTSRLARPTEGGARPPREIFTSLFKKHKAKHQEIHFPAQDPGPPGTALGKREGGMRTGTDRDNAGR